jgi:probable rRNA maturation factor
VVHGALHLAGLDHERARDAAIMEAAERRILARLGFDDPYRR